MPDAAVHVLDAAHFERLESRPAVSQVPEATQERYSVRTGYFYADVTTERLNKIAQLFGSGKLGTNVGTVLPLAKARIAHEMLGGAPHKRGKIVLSMAA